MNKAIGSGGSRPTRQAEVITRAMADTDSFRSAQDVYSDLRHQGEAVGLTTVYRRLQAMAASGVVDALQLPGGEVRYRLCATTTHHHHLVCRDCGRTVEVAGPGVERWAAQVADTNGFTDIEHTIELFGTCAACAG